MKSIFSYTDYRAYLGDYFSEKKQSEKGFSYARFSKSLGLSSPNYSQLILHGKRSLTLSNAHYAADGLELNADERQYFEILVSLDEIKEPRHVRILKERMKRLQQSKPKTTQKIARASNELNQWYLPAILVYFAGKSENTKLENASRSIGICLEEVKEGLLFLLKKGFLKIHEKRYNDVSQILWTDRKGMNHSQINYLSKQLELSGLALKKSYDRGAKFGAHTITISYKELAWLADRFESLIETVVAESDAPENEEVLQINYQIFNLKHLEKV